MKYKMPTKAIIPAAGFGTRTLPLNKSIPKEILPVWDKPVIQYVIEDLVSVGVEDIIIVTSPNKKAIEDYFSEDAHLDHVLRSKGKDELADKLQDIEKLARISFIRQHGSPLGNQLPVDNAKHLLTEGEPFFVMWADDFFQTERKTRCQQLLDVYSKTGNSVVGLIDAGEDAADKYALPMIEEDLGDDTYHISGLLEKPGKGVVDTTFASVGGMLLTYDVVPLLGTKQPQKEGGEVAMADLINVLAADGKVDAKLIDGKFQDGGDIFKYTTSVIDMALADEKRGAEMLSYLEQKVKELRK